MQSETTIKLITYSIGATRFRETGNFFEVLVPFGRIIALKADGKIFEPEDFIFRFKEAFGLSIPIDAVDEIVKVFRSAKILVSGDYLGLGDRDKLLWQATKTQGHSSNLHLNNLIKELFDHFHEFLKQMSGDDLFLNFTREQAEQLLFDFLVSKVPAIRKADETFEQLETKSSTLRPWTMKSQQNYLCSRFLEKLPEISENCSKVLDQISDIAMLACVIPDLANQPKTLKLRKNNSPTIFLMDTDFAIEFLGLAGKASMDRARQLVRDLKSLGCVVAIFDITAQELKFGLKNMMQRNPVDRYGAVHHAMLRSETSQDYVEYVSKNAEDALLEANIKIEYFNLTDVEEKFLSSTEKEELLQNVRRAHEKDNAENEDAAIDHDMKIIKWIVARRKRRGSRNFLSVHSVFLTGNSVLSASSRLSFMDKNHVSPVMTSSRCATRVWLLLGGENISISRLELLQNCSSVCAANPNILDEIKSTLNEVDEKKAHQFSVIANTPRHMQLAMDSYFISRQNLPKIEKAEASYDFLIKKLKSEIGFAERTKSDKLVKDIEENTKIYEAVREQNQKLLLTIAKRIFTTNQTIFLKVMRNKKICVNSFQLFIALLVGSLLGATCYQLYCSTSLSITLGLAIITIVFKALGIFFPFNEEKLAEKYDAEIRTEILELLDEGDDISLDLLGHIEISVMRNRIRIDGNLLK